MLEDDVEGTVGDLYADDVVTAADLEALKAAVEALRRTAFAGKRRRRDIDPRTDDLLYCLEVDKAKRAEESNKFSVTHPIDHEFRQCRTSGRGGGVISLFPAETEIVEVGWR